MTAGQSLGAVALIIPNYDAAIAFFTAIGFELTADIDQGAKRWVTVRPAGGGAALVLAQPSCAAQSAAIGTQGAFGCSCTRMISPAMPHASPLREGCLKRCRGMNPMAAWRFGATLGATAGI